MSLRVSVADYSSLPAPLLSQPFDPLLPLRCARPSICAYLRSPFSRVPTTPMGLLQQ